VVPPRYGFHHFASGDIGWLVDQKTGQQGKYNADRIAGSASRAALPALPYTGLFSPDTLGLATQITRLLPPEACPTVHHATISSD
jgi:hypothetical protein